MSCHISSCHAMPCHVISCTGFTSMSTSTPCVLNNHNTYITFQQNMFVSSESLKCRLLNSLLDHPMNTSITNVVLLWLLLLYYQSIYLSIYLSIYILSLSVYIHLYILYIICVYLSLYIYIYISLSL